ncbi:hypothetical protein N752_30025 [Desulforamulus aquiferis]|nr:hypothetical protein N752_30025 [Desulforamulus aquiferis]
MRHSDEFKYSIIKRMMPPNNESVNVISRETGLSVGTLHSWKRKARANGIAVPGGESETEKWSTQDKFLIVVETASLSEIELAEYCRSKGLFVEQVQAWRDACMQANGGVAQQAAQLQKDLRQRESLACKILGISQRTLQRWRSSLSPDEDQRKHAKRMPANKLSPDERDAIIKTANQPEFKSLPPSQIVPRLADQGVYIASESTFYRILKENNMQHHRGRAKKPSTKPISTHVLPVLTKSGCGIITISG